MAYVLKRFPRISETFVAAELIELTRQGERVTVLAISRPAEPFVHAFLADLRVPIIYMPYRPLREPARVARALVRALRSSPRGWVRAARTCVWPPRLVGLRRLLQATVLRAEMERAEIDHAHAHFATAAARLADLAHRMGGPTWSVTAHAKDIYHRDVRTDRLRDRLASARFVATVSKGNRRQLRDVLGRDGDVHVVPNSVDVRRLAPSRRRPEPGLVLAVARLIEKKGLDVLVEACGLLQARGVTVRLEVAGDGPLGRRLAEHARLARVDSRFHGALPQEEVLALYRRAAVFCLPCVVASTGDRDGLPTSVLEAMALGVPVVTTAVNGLADAVVDEVTGLVVPERDEVALAGALGRVLGDRALGERLAGAARARVERCFNLERSTALLRELWPA